MGFRMGLMDLFTKNKNRDADDRAALKSAALRKTAMDNARAARERLGDDTILEIAEKLSAQSAGKKAQRELQAMDKAVIADHLKRMLDDK